ncbi:carbon storage regulator [Pseudomonas sp. NPDC087697]|uniref:carbon storage regulator n=1 Tax=Pseudomonas sp. NPDC087697 TaxID=3364447 RepID=UPI0037FC7FE0
MLKFNQKIGDSIRIDDEIQIKVFEIDRNKVTLGFEAPRHVRIYRTELYLQTTNKKSNTPE